MERTEDLQKVVAEIKKLEKKLRLALTIQKALELLNDNLWFRKGYMGSVWGFQTIRKEDVNTAPFIAPYGNIPDYHYTRVDYHFMHKDERYFVRWIRNYPENPNIGSGETPHIWVYKGNELVFEAKVKSTILVYPIELLVFIPQGEWYLILLHNLEEFLKEAVPIRNALRREEKQETQQ